MKKAFISLAVLLVMPLKAEILPTLGLGEETVKPLLYPKFTISGDYAGDARVKSLQNSNIQKKAKGMFDAGIGIEVGVSKYLNAGFDLTFRHGVLSGGNFSSLGFRIPFFVKFYFLITDRISIFMKGHAGPALTLSMDSLDILRDGEDNRAVAETYRGGRYAAISYGLTTLASAGIDIYPWSRIGFSLQWGIRYDIYRANRSQSEKMHEAPSSVNFSMMDFPATLTVLLVL